MGTGRARVWVRGRYSGKSSRNLHFYAIVNQRGLLTEQRVLLPLQLRYGERPGPGDTTEYSVPEWWARDRGLY